MDRRAVLRRALLPAGALLAGCTGVLGGDRPASTTETSGPDSSTRTDVDPRTPDSSTTNTVGQRTTTGVTTETECSTGTGRETTATASAGTPTTAAGTRNAPSGAASMVTFAGDVGDADPTFAPHSPFVVYVTSDLADPADVTVDVRADGDDVYTATRTLEGDHLTVGLWYRASYAVDVSVPELGRSATFPFAPAELLQVARRGDAVVLHVSPDGISRHDAPGGAPTVDSTTTSPPTAGGETATERVGASASTCGTSTERPSTTTVSEEAATRRIFEQYRKYADNAVLAVIGNRSDADSEFSTDGPFAVVIYPDLDDDGTTDVSVAVDSADGGTSFGTTRTLEEGEGVGISIWDLERYGFEVRAPELGHRAEFTYSPAEMLETVQSDGTVNVAVQPEGIDVSRVYMT